MVKYLAIKKDATKGHTQIAKTIKKYSKEDIDLAFSLEKNYNIMILMVQDIFGTDVTGSTFDAELI